MKLLMTILITLLLAGCGGGGSGGGGNNDTQNNTSNEPQTQSVSMNENGETRVDVSSQSLSVKNSSIVSASGTDGRSLSDVVDITFTDSQVLIKAKDVDRPTKISFELVRSDSNTVVYRFDLMINNTSGKSILNKAENILAGKEAVLNLKSDRKVYFFMVDRAYLKGAITFSDKEKLIQDFSANSASTYTSLFTSFKELDENIDDYNKGKISDNELEQFIDEIDAQIKSHGEYGVQKITNLALPYDDDNIHLPDLTMGEMKYVKNINRYSRFVGNESYGSFVNGSWQFDKEYEMLTKLANPNNIGVCAIQ